MWNVVLLVRHGVPDDGSGSPMPGRRASLNVAGAGSLVLYRSAGRA